LIFEPMRAPHGAKAKKKQDSDGNITMRRATLDVQKKSDADDRHHDLSSVRCSASASRSRCESGLNGHRPIEFRTALRQRRSSCRRAVPFTLSMTCERVFDRKRCSAIRWRPALPLSSVIPRRSSGPSSIRAKSFSNNARHLSTFNTTLRR